MRRVTTRPTPPSPIGEAVPRRDGVDKVTGSGRFTVDLGMPGLAHAKIVRSPYPHARLVAIDTEAARRHPGVIAVVTADDLADVPVPGHKYTFGVVKAAQARGDLQVLGDRGRRAVRVHLGRDVRAGLAALRKAVEQALR